MEFRFLEERYELIKSTVLKDFDTYTSIINNNINRNARLLSIISLVGVVLNFMFGSLLAANPLLGIIGGLSVAGLSVGATAVCHVSRRGNAPLPSGRGPIQAFPSLPKFHRKRSGSGISGKNEYGAVTEGCAKPVPPKTGMGRRTNVLSGPFCFTRKQMFRVAAVFPAASVHHLAAGRIAGVGPDSLKSGPIALRQPAGPLLRVFPFCPDIVMGVGGLLHGCVVPGGGIVVRPGEHLSAGQQVCFMRARPRVRLTMVHASARVMLSSGWKVPSGMPSISPYSTAAARKVTYHSVPSTSENRPSYVKSPSVNSKKLTAILVNSDRVMGSVGRKVPSG